MTPPKADVKCRRCGKRNDNQRRHASGQRVRLCVKCETQREAEKRQAQEERRASGYAAMLDERTCEWCGETYLARINNQRFCTLACRNLNLSNWRKSQRVEMRTPIECGMCGTTFVRTSGNGKYCSDECRLKVKRRDAWINHLRGRYRITTQKFDAMLEAAGNRCQVCGVEFSKRSDIHVDHDHSCCPGDFTCGKCVRGLVCKSCNFMLGFANDNPQRLRQGLAYLKRYGIK